MKNIIRISALCAAFAACGTLLPKDFISSLGNVPGCMYYKGQVVNAVCVRRVLDYNKSGAGYDFNDFVKCITENGAVKVVASTVPFVNEESRLQPMPACQFDSDGRRAYYNYNGQNRLYRRYLSCRNGCRVRTEAYSFEFEENLIKTELLAEFEE